MEPKHAEERCRHPTHPDLLNAEDSSISCSDDWLHFYALAGDRVALKVSELNVELCGMKHGSSFRIVQHNKIYVFSNGFFFRFKCDTRKPSGGINASNCSRSHGGPSTYRQRSGQKGLFIQSSFSSTGCITLAE